MSQGEKTKGKKDRRHDSYNSARHRLPSSIPSWKASDFLVNLDDLQLGEEVSKGAFGSVHRATFRGVGVCAKRQLVDGAQDELTYLLSELALLRGLQHDNIVDFVGAAQGGVVDGRRELFVVTEFLDGGDVHNALGPDRTRLLNQQGGEEKNPTSPTAPQALKISVNSGRSASAPALEFGWLQRLRVALHSSRALSFIHKKGTLHRDVKSHNLLLSDHTLFPTCKLCDFGMARGMPNSPGHRLESMGSLRSIGSLRSVGSDLDVSTLIGRHQRTLTICGTDEYMAPEMILGEAYTDKADMFSFGCVLIELICGRAPATYGFLERVPQSNFEVDENEMRQNIIEGCPASLIELAAQCCAGEEEFRPSAEEAREWLEELYTEFRAGRPSVTPRVQSIRLSVAGGRPNSNRKSTRRESSKGGSAGHSREKSKSMSDAMVVDRGISLATITLKEESDSGAMASFATKQEVNPPDENKEVKLPGCGPTYCCCVLS